MTNAPEGRTYINYRWDIREGAREYFSVHYGCWRYEAKDVTEVRTPHVVPNGKWVMERPYGWAWLIGVEFGELEDIQYTDKHGIKHVLYISDKPFGYIVADEEDVDMAVYPPVIKPTGRKRLVCAQQIHQGEIGQSVPIERLSYIRQAYESGQKPNVQKARERKRGNRGWVRLTELAASTGFSVEDIVFGFWSYSGHRNYWTYNNNQEGGQLLDIVIASSPADIEYKCPKEHFVMQSEVSGLIRESVEDLWVRRGFAYTVLRLLALGVRPELHQFV